MSQKFRIGYKNLWRDGTISLYRTQHPQFPVENTQDDDKALHWRSRHGAGTGNGYFDVYDSGASQNSALDFNDSDHEVTALLTPGYYTGQTLAAQIKTKMDGAGSQTYTVIYNEATCKFTISAPGNFWLLWYTGTHKTVDISGLCGFSDAADDTGSNTYTADYMRIHSSDYLRFDNGTGEFYNFVALLNHNLQSTATISITGAENSDMTGNPITDVITYYANNIFFFLSAVRMKRYLQFNITDIDNPSGYIKIGNIQVYKYIELARYPKPSGYSKGVDNPSLIDLSDSQNLYVDDKPRLFKRSYSFKGLSDTDASNIMLMQEECGDHKGIVVCTDPDNPNTASEFVTLAELNEVQYEHVNYWNWTTNVREHK